MSSEELSMESVAAIAEAIGELEVPSEGPDETVLKMLMDLHSKMDTLIDGVRQIGEQQQYTTNTVAAAKAEFDRMMSGGMLGKLMGGLMNPLGGKNRG